jgi:hypothetical protein
LIPSKGEHESTHVLDEHSSGKTLELGMLEKLVKNLVPSLQRGDPFFVPAFLYTYQKFSTTRQVPDLFLKGEYPRSRPMGFAPSIPFFRALENTLDYCS